MATTVLWMIHELSHNQQITQQLTNKSRLTRSMADPAGLLDPYSATQSPPWMMNNLWMQYVNYTVRTTFNSSCLVCQGYKTKLSVVGLPEDPDCTTDNINKVCLIDCLLIRASKQTTWDINGILFQKCPPHRNAMSIPPLLSTLRHIKPAQGAKFVCFNRTYGNVSVGITPLNCTKTHTLYPPLKPGHSQSSEVAKGTIQDGVYGRRYKRDAFDAGMNAMPDVYWMCGKPTRTLPANWTGVCALVMLAQEIHILPTGASDTAHFSTTQHHRMRRALQKLLGSFDIEVYIDDIGVPRGSPLCWWCTTNKNVDWINYLYYNQQRFINHTHDAIGGIAEQLAATSQMTWENRMETDMLLADKGGVCTMFGDSCCTSIPNNTAPDGSVTKALEGLNSLRDELKRHSGYDDTSPWGWFDIMFGRWKTFILSLLTGVVIGTTALTLCRCCFIPCARMLIMRTIDHSISYQMALQSMPLLQDNVLTESFDIPNWEPPYCGHDNISL
ncbi:hypothetical protein Q5P01_000256 [Channa striata]|uniref:Uncharacterized protein n=1 Tax=Channa striata TaxID=64152 RepID=A0AA88IVV8_CHASR|nr:hypothetical protein Q5P01_000256 [Channa striata]